VAQRCSQRPGVHALRVAPDSPSKSVCYGVCAATGPDHRGADRRPWVTGKLGTIRRSGGSLQATYDHRPLYTYIGDSAPGQPTATGFNLNGGLGYEVAASGG